MTSRDPARQFLALAEHSLRRHHLPRIETCLKLLSEEQIWWRPNRASNSAGNLALHLEGNLRQWIVSGLGGAVDARRRDLEFAERGPVSRGRLIRALHSAVLEASGVLRRLSAAELSGTYSIQRLRVSGLNAVLHVVEHFAFHAGQIVYIVKLKGGRDLAFTRLPGQRRGLPAGRGLPVL